MLLLEVFRLLVACKNFHIAIFSCVILQLVHSIGNMSSRTSQQYW